MSLRTNTPEKFGDEAAALGATISSIAWIKKASILEV